MTTLERLIYRRRFAYAEKDGLQREDSAAKEFVNVRRELTLFEQELSEFFLETIQKFRREVKLSMERMVEERRKKLYRILKKHMREFIKRGVQKANDYPLPEGMERKIDWNKIAKEALEFLDGYIFALSEYVTAKELYELNNAVYEGILRGEGAREISKRIKKLGPRWQKKAEMIARTEGMRALNQGRLKTYQEMGYRRYVWIASDLACPECSGYDGKVYKLNELPPIPAHPRCRCTIAPVTRFTKIKRGRVEWE